MNRKYMITGSRNISNYEMIEKILNKILKSDDILIFGDARGVDTLVHRYCHNHEIQHHEPYKPDWKIGKHAGLLRNLKMIDECDLGSAIWDGISRGTMHAIEYLSKFYKIDYIFKIKNNEIIQKRLKK